MTTTRLTRYDRSMLRLMNDRRGQAWYATAARRRLAVAAHITLTVAIGALMTHFFLAEGEPLWPVAAMAVLLLPWMVATGVINGATRACWSCANTYWTSGSRRNAAAPWPGPTA
jgi:hypothetical protein